MNWLSNVFKVQSRESEKECSIHSCVNHVINHVNEYTPSEKIEIAHKIHANIRATIVGEHLELLEEIKEYKGVLGLI